MDARELLLLTLVDGFIVSSPILRADVARTHAYMKVDYDKTPMLRAGVARTYAYMKVDYDKTLEGDYPHPHDDDYKFGDITKRVIRDMTGNKEYQFGDGTKALSQASQEAAEAAASAVIDAGGTAAEAGAAAKQALDDSGYQFGDITKSAVKGFEQTVRDATGNDGYKFGDVTKNLAKGLFGALEKGAAAAKEKVDDK